MIRGQVTRLNEIEGVRELPVLSQQAIKLLRIFLNSPQCQNVDHHHARPSSKYHLVRTSRDQFLRLHLRPRFVSYPVSAWENLQCEKPPQ